MKKEICFSVMFLTLLVYYSPITKGSHYTLQGGTGVLQSITYGSGEVWYNATLNILDNGRIDPGYLEVHDTSTVNILANTSYVTRLKAWGNSEINILNGDVCVFCLDDSNVNVFGGIIHRDNDPYSIYAIHSCKVNIYGGQFTGNFTCGENAKIIFHGTGFKINGVPVTFGQYFASDFSHGILTGTLGSGSLLNNVFDISGNASITLVPEPKTPPVADAGSDQTVMDADDNGSEQVILNGSGSSDSDGNIISYVWSEQSNQIATGVNPTVTLTVGIHTITLTVNDNDGLTDTDTVTVTVEAYPNQPPVADAGSDQNVMDADDSGNEQIALDGSDSTDSDGAIQSYVWSEGGTQIATGVNPMVTLPVGTHVITLTVTDDDGLANTDNVTVTIEPYPNQQPDANADGPYTIYVDDTLILDASGSTDEHNNIVSYLWDLDDNNSFETDAGSNAVFDVNYAYLQSLGLLIGNTYKIHLKVTDGGGLSNVASTTLTIIPAPALRIIVDIKPGSCPNPLNVKSSGVLPVAILGTADFDVSTIDATSIRLAGVSPLRSSVEDVAGPFDYAQGRPANDSNDCNCTEDGPDGLADLTLKFKTERIVEAIGDVNEGDVLTLELTGVLIGERPIEGADCVVVVGKHKPCNKFDINEDGVVDYSDFCEFAQNWMQSSILED